MKHRSYLLSAILFVISLHCAYADEVRFFDNSEISSHLLTSICQDHDGFVWVGTEYGLNRFDGMVFTHYYAHTHSLVDNYIHEVFTDKDGDVLVISGRTLQIYDGNKDIFNTVAFPEGHVPVLSDIAQLHDGRIVVANSKKGLWLIDKDAMVAAPFTSANDRIGTPESHNLFVDSKGRLWICTNNDGVFVYYPETGHTCHMQATDKPYASKGVTGVVESDDGEILVLGMTSFLRFDERNDALEEIFTFSPALSVRRLYRSNDGILYSGSYGKGVYCIDVDAGKIVPAFTEVYDDFGLGGCGMYSFLNDADGNLWMGFNTRGLLLMTNSDQPFSYTSLKEVKSLSNNFLTSFSILENGCFLVGQSHEGLHLFDRENSYVKTYLKGRTPVAVCQISEDKVWVGDFSRGACLLDLRTGKEKWLQNDRRVTDFARDSEGNIYMAVFNGPLVSYTPDGLHERVLGQNAEGITLHGRYLNSLYTDSQGLIWIGHYYGFDVYDPMADAVITMPCHEQLRKAVVYEITEASDGIVWLGTSRGLFGYDRKDGSWVHKSAEDGLTCEIICSIRQAPDSTLWLSTYRGLIHYDVKDDEFSYYLQGDGLQEICYSRGISALAPDGRIYFGNDMGVTSFYPEDVTLNSFVRPVKSVTLMTGGRTVDIDGDRIVLSHDESTFALRFSTMDFRNPQNLSFEYSLSAFKDKGWRRTTMGYGEVDFYNLSYGEHVLKVRSVYNESRSETKEITIRITAPWYLTLPAKILYVVLVILFCFFFWLSWKHRKLAEVNEEKIRLFIDISHEIRSPLTLIKSPLESIIKEPHDERTSDALKAIQRNTDRLLLLVNQILSIRKIEKGQMKMHYSETEMLGFVKDYVQDFEYSAAKRKIGLTVTGPDEPVSAWVDREHFGKVVTNLVSNALKYVEDGGEVAVSLRVSGKMLELHVADNGKGIDEKQLKHVFERFYQVKSESSSSQLGFGIGLNLSSQIVRLHGGTIEARNRSGASGSEFIVRLMLGKNHLSSESIVGPDYYVRSKDDFKEETVTEEVVRRRSASRKRTDFKVVVVDDDEEMCRFLDTELSKSYYVSSYPDGRQALEAVTENPPDLVISDVSMPDMDGFTLLKRIKNNTSTSHVPVILLTTKVEHQSRLDGFGYGADAYLDKPFNIDELMTVAESLIGNRLRMKAKISGVQEQKGVMKPIEMKGNDAALMERIMACVNKRICDSDFNVEALADEVGLSRVQLHRRIKEITGITVGEFLRNLRMKQAAQLLMKGDVTVSQVTYAVGMSNPTHFTTAFKKYYGVTPTEYINKHKQ